MDDPWKTLGRKHRQMRHDPWWTPLEALILSRGDWKAYASAAYHIMLDKGALSPAQVELLYRLKQRSV